jgi:hypothetical protein
MQALSLIKKSRPASFFQENWRTNLVTLSEAQGLAARFFATPRLTEPR